MSTLLLTVVLAEVEPRVVRTLMVPSELRLDRLHLAIQAAMGWQTTHLYEFAAGHLRWGLPHPDYNHEVLPARRSSVQEALTEAGTKPLRYTYDFGDNWRHWITATPTDGPIPGHLYPRLVEIVGRCPPEDVGGVPGYEHFLEAIADPRHPDHEELLDWHGEPFDPSVPHIDELQLDVLKLAKRWKPRKT